MNGEDLARTRRLHLGLHLHRLHHRQQLFFLHHVPGGHGLAEASLEPPTIPQLSVKGEFVGGCDIVREMYESGELTEYLDSKGISRQMANPE